MAASIIEHQFEGVNYIIEEILDKRRVKIKGRSDVFKIEYYVKWKDFSASENTWEPAKGIKNKALIAEFEEQRQRDHAENFRKAVEAREKEAARGPRGFDRGLRAEGIAGVMFLSGVLHFLMEWENCNEMDLIPASIVNKKLPQMVIAFYESRMWWKSMAAGRIIREEEEKIREIPIAENRETLRIPEAGPSDAGPSGAGPSSAAS